MPSKTCAGQSGPPGLADEAEILCSTRALPSWPRSDIGPVEIPQCRLSSPDVVTEKNWQNGQKLEARNTQPHPSRRTTCRLALPKQIGPYRLPWLRHITWPSR